MITKKIVFVLFVFINLIAKAQTSFNITGTFPPLAGLQVQLIGFDGFGIYTIDSTKITEQGTLN